MISRFCPRVAPLCLSGCLAVALYSSPSVARQSSAIPETPAPIAGQKSNVDSASAIHEITPGPIDGKVAYLTASMLEAQHYSKKLFDESVSSKFLDIYLDTLDPQRIHFTQGDVAEFEQYRTNLNHLILTDNGAAGARAGCVIYNRFFERLSQRTEYAETMLKNERFSFDTDERITINRKGMAYPKDLEEARQLWRQRVRFE